MIYLISFAYLITLFMTGAVCLYLLQGKNKKIDALQAFVIGAVAATLAGYTLLGLGLFTKQTLLLLAMISTLAFGFVLYSYRASHAQLKLFSGKRAILFFFVAVSSFWFYDYNFLERNVPTVCWYYFKQAMDLAQSTTIPSTVAEYGEQFPFETDKIGFNIYVAILLKALPEGATSMQQIWLSTWQVFTVFMAGLCIFSVSVFRKYPVVAVFSAAFVLFHPFIQTAIGGLRGEVLGAGYGLAMVGAMLRLNPVSPKLSFALIGLLSAGVILAHPDSAVFFGLFGASVVVVRAGISLIGEHNSFPLRQACFALAFGLGIVALVWSTLAHSPLSIQSSIVQTASEIPDDGRDSTLVLKNLMTGYPYEQVEADQTANVSDIDLIWERLNFWADAFYPHTTEISITVVLLLALLMMWITPAGRVLRNERKLALMLSVCGLFLMSFIYLFASSQDLQMIKEHPINREGPYILLLPAFGAGFALLIWAKVVKSLFRINTVRIAAIVSFAIFALTLQHQSAERFYYMWKGSTNFVSHDGLRAYEFIKNSTPQDSMFMVDGISEGVFSIMSERSILNEGRSPYLQPANREKTIKVLKKVRYFFNGDTASPPESVDYVITGSEELGVKKMLYLDGRMQDRDLTKIKQFGDIKIYQKYARISQR